MASSLSAVAAAPASKVARRGWETLALLSVAHFFIDLYSGALGAFQPPLVQKLSMSLSQAGLLAGLFMFSSSFLQPVYGVWADRFPTRLISALAPAIAGIFISSLGLAPSYGWLLVLVVLGGVGIAAFHPQASANATLGIPVNRGRWMAVFISSGTLGLAAGPPYFSALIGWRGLEGTWWGAVPGLLMTLVLLARLPAMRGAAEQRAMWDWAPFRPVWRPLLIHYLLVVIRSVVQVTFAQFLPLYLTRERGLSLQDASLAVSLYLAFGACGGFLGGSLADRFGGRRVILVSMLSCVPFLSLFFLAEGSLSLLGLALGGLTLLFTIPVNVLMAQELVPGQSGTVSALMMGFAWGMAGLIFIPLTGLVADHVSLHYALFSLLAFPLVGFFLTLRLPK